MPRQSQRKTKSESIPEWGKWVIGGFLGIIVLIILGISGVVTSAANGITSAIGTLRDFTCSFFRFISSSPHWILILICGIVIVGAFCFIRVRVKLLEAILAVAKSHTSKWFYPVIIVALLLVVAVVVMGRRIALVLEEKSIVSHQSSYPIAARSVLTEIQELKTIFGDHTLHACEASSARMNGDTRMANIKEAAMCFAYTDIQNALQRVRKVAFKIRDMPTPPSNYEGAHRELIEASIQLSKFSQVASWTGTSPPSLAEIMTVSPYVERLSDSIKRLDILLPK